MNLTRSTVDSIINTMNSNDIICQSAPQQVANGFYRVVDMLAQLIAAVDLENKTTLGIANVLLSLHTNNISCQGAPQQSANGAYRTVDMLKILIELLDDSAARSVRVTSIMTDLSINNAMCQGAPQQMANGAYRIVDMLVVLVDIIDPSLNVRVNGFKLNMDVMNAMCQGAPQQTANGTSTIACIVDALARSMDKQNRHGAMLDVINSLKERNNAMCQGADQQSANYLYRTMEMLQIIGYILVDKLEQRNRDYWAAHGDEYTALNNEKSGLEQKIRDTEAEAGRVNDGGEGDTLRKKKRETERLRDDFGRERLQETRNEISKLEQELGSLGLFKFAEKKAARARIEEAQKRREGIEMEVRMGREPYEKQIRELSGQISAVEKRIKDRKQNILDRIPPMRTRIEEIDKELTRQR